MTQYKAKREYEVTYKLGTRTITQRLTFISLSETSAFAIFESPTKHNNKIAISGKYKQRTDGSIVQRKDKILGEIPEMEYFYQNKQVETIGIPLCNIIDTAHRG